MHSTVFSPAMSLIVGQIVLKSLGMAIGLEKGNL